MADYRWGDNCKHCGRYKFMSDDHAEDCPKHRNAKQFRAILAVGGGFTFMPEVMAYKCKRGCGTLVWDIESHVQNVCKSKE